VPNLYTRNQGGTTRYYADLRDIGGGQFALKAAGATRATSNEAEALKLPGLKLEELESAVPVTDSAPLGGFAECFVREDPGQVEVAAQDTVVVAAHAVRLHDRVGSGATRPAGPAWSERGAPLSAAALRGPGPASGASMAMRRPATTIAELA
jgi:hypothetical protein